MSAPHYTTTDPYLASFLLNEGGSLAGCTRLGPKKVEFCFVADAALHELLRRYWSKQRLLLVPFALFAALRHLKSRTLTRRR